MQVVRQGQRRAELLLGDFVDAQSMSWCAESVSCSFSTTEARIRRATANEFRRDRAVRERPKCYMLDFVLSGRLQCSG